MPPLSVATWCSLELYSHIHLTTSYLSLGGRWRRCCPQLPLALSNRGIQDVSGYWRYSLFGDEISVMFTSSEFHFSPAGPRGSSGKGWCPLSCSSLACCLGLGFEGHFPLLFPQPTSMLFPRLGLLAARGLLPAWGVRPHGLCRPQMMHPGIGAELFLETRTASCAVSAPRLQAT